MAKRSGRWLLLFGCVLFVSIYFLAKRSSGKWSPLSWFTRNWVKFDVPSAPLQMRGRVALTAAGIKICNDNSVTWSDSIVKLTNRVNVGGENFDSPLYAKSGNVESGTCVDLSNGNFYSASWKKIPAPSQMNVVKVEILANVRGAAYFVQDHLTDNLADAE